MLRQKGGREFISVDDTAMTETQGLECYVRQSDERLIAAVRMVINRKEQELEKECKGRRKNERMQEWTKRSYIDC